MGNNYRRRRIRGYPHARDQCSARSTHVMPRKLKPTKCVKSKKKVTPIEGKKFYSLYEINMLDLFETGVKNKNTRKNRCRSIITTDKYTNNYLKSMIVPHARGRQYVIRGSDIIKYLVNKYDNA